MAANLTIRVDDTPVRIHLAPAPDAVLDAAALAALAGKASITDLASTASGKGVDLIGYKWPGALSVTRELRDKIGEGEIVLDDFGGVPDGATDSSSATDAVFNEMNLGVIGDRQRRLRVKLNAGQYRFTAPIETGAIQDFAMIGAGPELTSLLIDHADGHGILYEGDGNALFQGFVIYGSDDRYAEAADDTLSGFVSDPGVASTTLQLRMIDVYSYRHPGKGIYHVNPEQSQIINCRAANNKGKGLHLYGRDLTNIMNRVDGFRARDNGSIGIHSQSLDHGTFIGCESLNSGAGVAGTYQMQIEGACNTVIQPDLEMFDHVTGATDYRGIALAGRKNQLHGGTYYGLNSAVRCANGDESVIWMPVITGKSGATMATGVVIDALSDNCLVVLGTAGADVTTRISNSSPTSTTVLDGRWSIPKRTYPPVAATLTAAAYTPDMAAGSTFLLTLTANATINAPTGLAAGDVVEFIFIQDGTGGWTVTFASGYKHAWSNTGNTAGKRSAIEFRSLGAATLTQKAAQGPYVS